MSETTSNFPLPLSSIDNVIKQWQHRNAERKLLHTLELLPEAKKTLKELLEKPNPEMKEYTFVGIGKDNLIEEIYIPEDFSRPSRSYNNGRVHGSKTDSQEMYEILDRVQKDGKYGQVILFGHTHPPVISRESNLSPSYGDLDAVRTEVGDPNSMRVRFEGVAAVLDSGSALKVYLRSDLAAAALRERQKLRGFEKKSKTFVL